MACVLIWIRTIFTNFWPQKDISRCTWKDKDFLQVQSEQYQRLCNVIPSLEKFLKDMEAYPKTKVLNKNQCIHLFRKLILAMKGIDKMFSSATKDLNFQPIFEELYCLQKKIEIVGNNCIEQDRWCHSVVFQFQNKETFRELLLDLKCCYDAAKDMYLFHHPNQSNDILSILFDAVIYEQVLEDVEEVKRKLELVLQGKVLENYEIAQHLLLRLRNLDRVDGGDLEALEIPDDFKPPKLIQKIGKGGYGDVYKSNWFGLPCATKVLKGDNEYLMHSRKEAGILAGLSHPNLVQFFGCGIAPKVDENPKEDEIGAMHLVKQLKKSSLFQMFKNLIHFFGFGIIKTIGEDSNREGTNEMYLVMELMDSNLSTILKKAKRPLPYELAIDIMHQIAKGVYYLHDMQVAHLDLKPDNVLSSSKLRQDLDPHRIFKVMDYGTSQLEVLSNPKHPEPSKYTIGTLGYMAPEMFKGSKTPVHPFQADVWSFAMMCSEILSGKVPYSGLKPKEFNEQLSHVHGNRNESLRPDLPNNCEELTSLIQECWSQDPLQRTPFSEICERLTSLKKSFLKGIYSRELVPQFGSPCNSRDFKSIVDHVPKVDEQISIPKEVLVDLEHQLSKAKKLLKLSYIGLVGMGGIGKTTLAKAILDDIRVNSLYHASCFVSHSTNAQSSYDILCKILPKLGNNQKPKNLEDAQMIMKELLVEKNVLLILDDVKEEAQVHDIVPLDIVKANKGTTIIITTRKWNTIKSFVGIEGRLDVELLDEEAATRLFNTHLSWGDAPSLLDFEDLRKHVVKACNGLPLSLKVMGSFLHNKKRLRSWERALQRMARGRNLDGDEEIWNTLKISYEGLNDDVEKMMFLDVACFFCRDVYPSGISKELMLDMWSKDGILPEDKLERLINMSLMKVSEDGETLELHDQLRDMGRMIAKSSRVWKASMIPESGFTSKEVEDLEGISLQGTMVKQDSHVHEGIFGQGTTVQYDKSFIFPKLRILILWTTLTGVQTNIDNFDLLLQLASHCPQLETILIGNSRNLVEFSYTLPAHIIGTFQNKISNLCGTQGSLKILDLIGNGFLQQLPNKFASRKTLLRLNLDSCFRLAKLSKEVGNLTSLKYLNLRGCSSMTELPKEVGNLTSLETFILEGCSCLAELPKEVRNLTNLTNLNLRGCSSLAELPKEVGNLTSLKYLNLRRCSRLAELPKEVGNLTSLETFILEGCSNLVELPKEVRNLTYLTSLNLRECSSLVELPKEVGNLTSLKFLNLEGCSGLAKLPKEVGNLTSVKFLNLEGCSSLAELPKEVGNLTSLKFLNLEECSSLAELPKEVGNLTSLETLNFRRCSSLVELPKEVGNLTSLETLNLRRCSSLAELPKEVGNLTSFEYVKMRDCSSRGSSLVKFPSEVGSIISFDDLEMKEYSSLVKLPKEVGNLTSLTNLNLEGCSSLAELPKEVGNLTSLTHLYLKGCSSLAELPKEVGNLTSLTSLYLEGCSSLEELPKEVENLTSLKFLNLERCWSLVELPKEVGNLTSLGSLYLKGCSSLEELPKEVGNLTSLGSLYLEGCWRLEELPKEVGNLTSLKFLNLERCWSLVELPKEVGNLTSLKFFKLEGCSSLAKLPTEMGNLTYLANLNLRGCSRLAELPKEVRNLTSLTNLNLKGCTSLAELPKEVGNLTSLTSLYLEGCSSLAELPKEVGNLTSLKYLYLEGCSSLAELPKEVGNLTSLKYLYLRGCSRLAELPKEVGNLTSLTNLDLRGCSSLAELPKEVGNLTSLKYLYLRGCSRLAELPKEVGNLTSLISLNLRGCSRLVELPKEVQGT